MIQLHRPAAIPNVLKPDSTRRRTAEDKIAKLIEAGGKPKSTDFTPLWGEDDVRSALWEMHNSRCCYCERLRDVNRESDIEHFRPKTAVHGETGEPGYWWLAYDWNNLFFSCRYCNQNHKKTHFPISGTRAKKKTDNLDNENADLVDPAKESPEDVIGFDWTHVEGQVMPYGIGVARKKTRGNATIQVCGLDRPELGLERHAILWGLKTLARLMLIALEDDNIGNIEKYGSRIRVETSANEKLPFVAFRRAFFRAWDLGEYVTND